VRLGAEQGQEEGTGIGLAISRRLVQAMKGEIGFASVVTQGSQFWVDLPVALEEAPETRSRATPPARVADDRPKILYIEDKTPNLELMRSILRDWSNAQFLEARSVQEGIRLARALKPHLVITDIHLPDGKGFDVLTSLRADAETRHIRIAALTADAMRNNLEQMQSAGFDLILTKPFKIAKIIEFVRSAA
jgi:CheY-like chemotaxis protein